MTIIERTSYVFNYPEEKEEADEFEKSQDMKQWFKSVSTMSVCYTKSENFHIERKETDRLEILKSELETVKNLHTLCFDLKEQVIAYYENEIRVIEEYGDCNDK